MSGVAGGSGEPFRRRSGAITRPARVVIRRPPYGWTAGLLGAGIKMVAGVLTVTTMLAALIGVTGLLWWAGDARIPVVVLVYGFVALAGCGFAVGFLSRDVARHARRSRLPRGPEQFIWEPGAGRVRIGLVWERDNPAVTSPVQPSREEDWQ